MTPTYRNPPAWQLNNTPYTEYKVTDVAGGGGVDTSGTMVDLLSSLSRGDSPLNQFDGGRINPQGIQVRLSGVVGDATNILRVLVFQWFDAVAPVPLGVLSASSPLAPLFLDNRENIKVLHDGIYKATQAYSGGAGLFDFPNKVIYIKSKRLEAVQFKATTAVPQKGGLYMLLLSDSSVPSNPQINYHVRTTFVDN